MKFYLTTLSKCGKMNCTTKCGFMKHTGVVPCENSFKYSHVFSSARNGRVCQHRQIAGRGGAVRYGRWCNQLRINTRERRIVFGKEYESFNMALKLSESGGPESLTISAAGVRAFRGQELSAGAVTNIQKSLADMNVNIAKEVVPGLVDIVLQTLGVP
jgi:hypothetical protein